MTRMMTARLTRALWRLNIAETSNRRLRDENQRLRDLAAHLTRAEDAARRELELERAQRGWPLRPLPDHDPKDAA